MSSTCAVLASARKTDIPPSELHRLLIPVKGADGAARAIGYAIRRRAGGKRVSVCLLHVEEAPTQWEALVKGHGAHADARRRRDGVFEEAFRMLEGLDIDFAAYVRTGPVVFSILDAAEELDCDEIVVPAAHGGLLRRIMSRDIVATLMARQRTVPVVAVSKRGDPMGTGA